MCHVPKVYQKNVRCTRKDIMAIEKCLKLVTSPGYKYDSILFGFVQTACSIRYFVWYTSYRFLIYRQPPGYLVRLPFYALAARDAHIAFSASESPNWSQDYVYEIGNLILNNLYFCPWWECMLDYSFSKNNFHLKYLVIGGWDNGRTVIRKQGGQEIAAENTPNVVSKNNPRKFIAEVSNCKC